MSSSQHFLLTTIVDAAEWHSGRAAWLVTATTSLHLRARERGLTITAEPTQLVEVLPGATKLRVTMTAEGELA